MDDRKKVFLAQSKLAIVGISSTKGFGNTVFKELKQNGYTVYPVSRSAAEINGVPCYKTLEEIPDVIDGVVTVVPPSSTEAIIEECARLAIQRIWMQPGSESEAAIRLAKKNGMKVIAHSCILMYAKPSFHHKPHVWLWKLVGKY